jgi:AcrR family transcriptional regulator
MAVADRKAREKQEMRMLILEAARQMFVDEGYAQVSIRRIAEKIEYSPATIYLYFKDKDEIYYSLHNEGFQVYLKSLWGIEQISDPFAKLQAVCYRYLQFGLDHPELYDLMFIDRAPVRHIEEADEQDPSRQSYEGFVHIVQACIDAGYLPQQDARLASFSLWAYVHGVIALIIRRRCPMLQEQEVKKIALGSGEMLLAMIESWKATPTR